VRIGFNLFDNLLSTDEIWLTWSGYTYSANSKIRSAENPREMHEEPLHLWKFGDGCECLEIELWQTTLCEETLTDKSCYKMLTHSFFCCKRKKRIVVFLEYEGERQNCEEFLENCIYARMVGCGLWPKWTPRLTTPDLLLWGFPKERIYSGAGETFWGRVPKLSINL
jgi:hypothetical protein